jgi:hypothetical protein
MVTETAKAKTKAAKSVKAVAKSPAKSTVAGVPTIQGRSIVTGRTKQAAAFKAAMHSSDGRFKGYDLKTCQLRFLAAGGPMWSKPIGLINYNWQEKHTDGVSATGTGEDRVWVFRGEVGNADALAGADAKNLKRRAQEVFDGYVAQLLEAGHSAETIKATPSINHAVETLGLVLNGLEGARRRVVRRKSRAKTS